MRDQFDILPKPTLAPKQHEYLVVFIDKSLFKNKLNMNMIKRFKIFFSEKDKSSMKALVIFRDIICNFSRSTFSFPIKLDPNFTVLTFF